METLIANTKQETKRIFGLDIIRTLAILFVLSGFLIGGILLKLIEKELVSYLIFFK